MENFDTEVQRQLYIFTVPREILRLIEKKLKLINNGLMENIRCMFSIRVFHAAKFLTYLLFLSADHYYLFNCYFT